MEKFPIRKRCFAIYVGSWWDENLTASLLRIGLDGSAVDLLLRVVYCRVVWLPDIQWFSCLCDDLRLTTQLASFTTITDWKVVPMAIVPSDNFLRF